MHWIYYVRLHSTPGFGGKDNGRSQWKKLGFSQMLRSSLGNLPMMVSCSPRDPAQNALLAALMLRRCCRLCPLLVRYNISAMNVATAFAGWQDVPSTYLDTSVDYSVPRLYQRIMTKKVKNLAITLVEEYYDSSHRSFPYEDRINGEDRSKNMRKVIIIIRWKNQAQQIS